MTTRPHSNGPPEQERGTATPDPSPAAAPGPPPGQPPPGYSGAYGNPAYPSYPGYPVQRSTNGLAIASLVLGILIIFWGLTSILALIFGYIARKQIRERGEGGDGLAVAGIVLGWVGVGLWAIFLLFGLFGATLFSGF
ncbi:MAG: DUF4190 domain-containing protein [Actinomycetota bacterium]|nr:DUF4190 domain-containing protein [Actinomycetota bacterium]